MTQYLGRWPTWVALLLVLAGVGLRVAAASRPGLWADEIFSLAMATGHSLEHPADEADATLGDYVEPSGAVDPAVFRRYAEQETPPAGPARVMRAVLKSDTNPPLYYLVLDPWTRLFGTGDAALRLFSVAWAVLSLPLIWLLARDVDGHRSAWSASVLFAFAPAALYYSVEGRMYSLLWFAALALGWLTVRMSRDDARPWHSVLWLLAGVAGLLTHYFFVFVWLPCTAWLALVSSGRRRRVAVLGGLTLLTVLPWYLQVPESLGRWRVTAGWLDGDLEWPRALGRPFALAGSLLSGRSYLGGWEHAWIVLTTVFLLMAVVLLARRQAGWLFAGPRQMLWAWVAAVCLGPLVFDLLMHSTSTEEPRYALGGLPAAILLAAVGLSRTPPRLHAALLAATVLAWLPGVREIVTAEVPRPSQPYREIDASIQSRVGPRGLVLVSSIPSGVIGVARYLEGAASMASWVPQLEVRDVEPDLMRLISDRTLVALAKVTHLGADAPAEPWLQAHAHLVAEDTFRWSSSRVLYFAPLQGETFEPAAAD